MPGQRMTIAEHMHDMFRESHFNRNIQKWRKFPLYTFVTKGEKNAQFGSYIGLDTWVLQCYCLEQWFRFIWRRELNTEYNVD